MTACSEEAWTAVLGRARAYKWAQLLCGTASEARPCTRHTRSCQQDATPEPGEQPLTLPLLLQALQGRLETWSKAA